MTLIDYSIKCVILFIEHLSIKNRLILEKSYKVLHIGRKRIVHFNHGFATFYFYHFLLVLNAPHVELARVALLAFRSC